MDLAHTDTKPEGTCQSCSHRIQSLQVPRETQRFTQNPFEVPKDPEAHTDTFRLAVPSLLGYHTDVLSGSTAKGSHRYQ